MMDQTLNSLKLEWKIQEIIGDLIKVSIQNLQLLYGLEEINIMKIMLDISKMLNYTMILT